jgi:conjugal transfer pilus assembly protein TraV
MYKLFLALVTIAILSACSTVGDAVNPYKSNFNCPYKESGRCVSMTGAYDESRQGPSDVGKTAVGCPSGGPCPLVAVPSASEAAYQENVYKKLSGLLDEPKTPLIAPPKVMRVLLLPYKNGKDLYMYRYAYFIVDDFRWVLDGNPAMEGH